MLALAVYLSAEFVACALPQRLAEGLALTLARIVFWMRPPARRQLERNLAWLNDRGIATRARPARSSVTSQASGAFQHFALSMMDFFRLSRVGAHELRDQVEVRGAEHLDAATRSGRGVIVLSAHSGCWEWGAAYLAAIGRRVHLVARQHPSPAVEGFFARRRRQWQVFRLCGRPLWIEASQALRRREWVAVTADREASFRLPGRVARPSTCAWVAALSRRTGALILPAVMLRLADGRYAACFEPPLAADAALNVGYRDALRRLLAGHAEQWSAFEPLPAWLAAAE